MIRLSDMAVFTCAIGITTINTSLTQTNPLDTLDVDDVGFILQIGNIQGSGVLGTVSFRHSEVTGVVPTVTIGTAFTFSSSDANTIKSVTIKTEGLHRYLYASINVIGTAPTVTLGGIYTLYNFKNTYPQNYIGNEKL